MRLAPLAAAALVVLVTPIRPVRAQAARVEAAGGEPRVVVTATRSTRLAPDRVTLLAVVEGTAESPADAVQRADRKLQSVLEAARPFAAQAGAASAVAYGVSPAPNVNGFPGSGGPTPYVARYTVRVAAAPVDQLLRLAAALTAAGASSTQSQGFEAAAADSVRRAQFADALAQARRDAEALAAALGGRLGAPVDVSTSANAGRSEGPGYVMFNRFEGPGAPPEVTVASTVTVRYRLVLPDSAR